MASGAFSLYSVVMPDDLYDRDILAWSEYQAGLLRRLARGERVNDLDWEHVVEEIEDVGLSELHGVESYLDLILLHLLKAHAWPGSESVNRWLAEVVAFQGNAQRRFAPSMPQRIALEPIYQGAIRQIVVLSDGQAPVECPKTCPFTLDQLLKEHPATLQVLFDKVALHR